jgi:hypothetical protein
MIQTMWRLLLVLAGCGRIDFDAVSAPDAALVTYRDVVLSDLPAGYWRLGDSGSTARDETGRFDGSYAGACADDSGALTGDSDGAKGFAAGCTIALGASLEFDGTAPFTVEVWWKPLAGNATSYLMMRETRTANMALPTNGYGLISASQGVYFERAVAMQNAVTALEPVTVSRFSHVVGVYDGASLTLYVDGVAVSTKPDARPVSPHSVGAYIGGIPPSYGLARGTLDEIAVYDTALAADRIALHHDIGVNGPR